MPRRFPEALYGILACPYDHKAPLHRAESSLVCSHAGCEKMFRILEGVPVLIADERSLFSAQDFTQPKKESVNARPTLKRRVWDIASKGIPSISLNMVARSNYARLRELLLAVSPNPRVLIVGSGEVGEGLEELIGDRRFTIVESDVCLSGRVQIIADGHDLPFLSESFDGVICQAVLEHVVDPQRCVSEIHRVLKPRGIAYAEVPFMQQVHLQAYDFTRFTLGGFRRLFRYFEEVSAGTVCGPGMALAWSLSHFFGSFSTSFIWIALRSAVLPFFIFWIKYFDYILVPKPKAADAASAVYFLGYKSEVPISDRDIVDRHWAHRGSARVARAQR
jgi:SAM-dependent methyltransferase/uncharacterized protein YbaR (Trm112 family)